MKNRIVFNYLGKVLIGFSILFVFPIIVSLIYNEPVIPFAIPQIISLLIGLLFNLINTKNENIYTI